MPGRLASGPDQRLRCDSAARLVLIRTAVDFIPPDGGRTIPRSLRPVSSAAKPHPTRRRTLLVVGDWCPSSPRGASCRSPIPHPHPEGARIAATTRRPPSRKLRTPSAHFRADAGCSARPLSACICCGIWRMAAETAPSQLGVAKDGTLECGRDDDAQARHASTSMCGRRPVC